jgi:putative transposase
VGVDVGLTAFATLSDGTEIENPRRYRAARVKLRRAQRRVARRRKGSNRRRKAVKLLWRVHARVGNRRADFHHKISRRLVDNFGVIAVEDLNVRGLARGVLAGPVNDAGWSSFIDKLAYKAERAGRVLVKVDPRGTAQRCVCGQAVPKTLAERTHYCASCGLNVGRDHASALEILRLGLSLQALKGILDSLA